MNMRYSFIFVLAISILFSFQSLWAQSYTNSNVGKLISNTIPSTSDTITVSTSIPIADINVRIDTLIHTYDADIDMYLITPAGDTLELSTDNGGSGDNYILTVLDQEATTSITAGTAPFTGSFIPEQDISTLYGTDAIGDWILFIIDDAGGDDGTLQQWGLDFTAQVGDDAGVASIDSPATPYCGGTGLWVTIANYGTNTLTSATVNWTLNGAAQTPFAWTGSVPPGGTDGPVMISSTIFVDNDSIVAWTSMPNGVPDGNPANDTSSTVVLTGIAGGTYTIGGVIGYPTFTAAVNDLNARGICGPVVFDVQLASSPYIEQIELGEIVGTNPTNTITFNGNGSTIRWGSTDTNNRHVVRLNGADYVTFNDMTIEVDPDSTYGWGIQLSNGSDHDSFVNVTVKGDTVSTATNYMGIIATGSNSSYTTGGNNANYLTIDSCTVIGSYYGIRLNGNTGGLDAVGNTIMNSTIQDFRYYGIYLDDTDGALVSGNDISRPNRSTAQSFYGTYLTGGNINCTIEKNYYHNPFGGVSGSTSLAYVIYFSSCDAPVGQENVVKNNVIYDINTDGNIYGIYNFGSDGAYYYNNTISIDYPSTAGTTRGFYQTSAATNIDFRNNVLTVTRGGTGTKHGLYFATSTSDIISDNNAIWVNPDVTFGNFGGTNYATYADWRTANGGAYDSLSVNADPVYVDLAGGDLTPTSGLVNDIGVSLAEVTEDILGNPRGVPPDPGAYEFTPSGTDVAVSQFINLPSSALPNSMVNFDIEVSNIGATSVPAGSLDVFLNGALNSSYGYSGLAALESDTVSASFTASASGSDSIVAALRMVTGDGNLLNDTLAASVNIDSIYAAPYFQDFEAGGALPMGWTNEIGDDFDWTADAGGTGSSGTGPAVDHTLGTSAGYYMYTESSSPNYPFKTANLSTPYFDLTGMTSPTMEFWFHMYGASMGELHFDVWSGGSWTSDARSPLIGQYQTSDTSAWIRGGIDLSPYIGQTIKVRFRGITGNSFTSDMAIDDVRLDEYSNLTPFPDEIQAGKITMPLLTKMPLTQTGIVSAVNFEGSFDNLGLSNTGDINVAVTNSSTVYSNSVTGVTIPGFQSQTFNFGPWDASATAADNYNIMMYSSNFTGVNDTAIAPLELGEKMGWDYGTHTTNIAYSSTLDNYIGTRFTLTDPDTLTSVSFLLTSSTTATDSFAIDLYTSVNDTPGVAFARIYRGTFGDFAPLPALVTFVIPGGMAMPAGDFYAICYNDTPATATYPIGADGTGLGGRYAQRRFAFRAGVADWIYFEDASGNFPNYVPIIRAGFQEAGEIHDFAVDSMVVEQACMTLGETYTVTARVTNVGNQPEGFTTIELHENGVFAGDDFVQTLDPGQSAMVSFPYAPTMTGLVKLDVVSLLLNDGNASNDTATTYVRVTEHDIAFVDDFEDTSFTFANWVVVDDPTTTGTWMIFPPPYPNVYTLPITSGGNVASADADEALGSVLSTAMLPLDMSGYDSVFVDFDSDWRTYTTSDTARLNVSNDGGATWTTVLEYAGVDARNEHVSLDLTSYIAGNANAVVAFQSIQPGWDWWWTIDNVCVSGVSPSFPTEGDIVINEIMYNPIESGTDSTEYIELYNNDDVTIDISGWAFTLGVDYTFPAGTILNPREFAVVAVDTAAIRKTYGTLPTPYVYQWSGALNNSGEAIVIENSAGITMDSVFYDDFTPWPIEPDGNGPSLELKDPNLDNTLGENWQASDSVTAPFGTPGAPNSVPGTVFYDDFEAYTAGMQLTLQTSDWTTWSGTPGTGEDPFVSDAHAYTGSNSVVIVQNNDLVHTFGSLTAGEYSISFKAYIPSGKAGYFNTLAGFTPNPFNWGMEAYFDVGGGGRLFGGSATAVTFSWTPDTWQDVEVIVNLNADSAYFYFEGSLIHSWKWTDGASGGGSPLQLDGNDFFGATANDEMYFDDYRQVRLDIPTGINDTPSSIPKEFALYQNYPNPFNPTTTIKYQVPRLADVTITIYNLLGQKVKTLVNSRKEPGYYEVEWNGLNDHGVQVATGLYIYRIQAADFVRSKKMILLK